jgi:hypothetical protein
MHRRTNLYVENVEGNSPIYLVQLPQCVEASQTAADSDLPSAAKHSTTVIILILRFMAALAVFTQFTPTT